jgi:hypothetical protein
VGHNPLPKTQWEALCAQAAAWKVQGLPPKVADGTNRWYSDAELLLLKRIAEQQGLRVVPYHYCYGPHFGAAQITEEADISAWAGQVFGAVIPDIEDEFMEQYEAAASFGKQVRASFSGLWMPTLYANPQVHPVPLLSLNPYMDAWLPQVYFAVWNGIAQSAIEYVSPQWQAFDEEARAQGQGGLKPILPIISTGNGVAVAQITDFIDKMQRYGYIGFWHAGTYGPYTEAVMQAPLPLIKEDTVNNIEQLQAADGSMTNSKSDGPLPMGSLWNSDLPRKSPKRGIRKIILLKMSSTVTSSNSVIQPWAPDRASGSV